MKTYPKRRLGLTSSISETLYILEQSLWDKGMVLCGVDEVGRGCLAGPVVVVAAILKSGTKHPLLVDSKTLSKQDLAFMYQWLQDKCFFTVSIGSPRIIDQHNIYQATAKQMRSALIHLLATTSQMPSLIAIDAMPLKLSGTPYEKIEISSIVKGDSKSASIAAASILAKVTRDRLMGRLEESFPGYQFATHKGYCTKVHQEMVIALQPSITHRNSFMSWFKNRKNVSNEQTFIFG